MLLMYFKEEEKSSLIQLYDKKTMTINEPNIKRKGDNNCHTCQDGRE